MTQKWCVNCQDYRNCMYDVCRGRCGEDCRERCKECKKLFTGEIIKGENEKLAKINSEKFAAAVTALAKEANTSGGTVEIRASQYETSILYHPPTQQR